MPKILTNSPNNYPLNLIEKNTALVKKTASELGFSFCGIAQAVQLDEDARRLETWLNQHKQGKMQYLENNFDLRIDPRKLVPGAKSVITVLQNYFPDQVQEPNTPNISKYAFGKDYHEIIRAKLKTFLLQLNEQIGEINGRGFVDSAPVLERAWAVKTGAGWIGKNGNLIRPKAGSFFFIATLIVDLPLHYDQPNTKDLCGTCTKCIDACPTQAILPNKTIEANHCISYFTIELKKLEITSERNYKEWTFGCDICQDVCPWNRFSKPHEEVQFKPLDGLLQMDKKQWLEIEETTFKARFKNSPLLRAKLKGIKRNIEYLMRD